MKIVLIGFMGSGKSTVAPVLAEALGLQAVEMDDLIIDRAGGRSIADIFAADGESAFRELESEVGQELSDRDGVVVSTGGGVVMNRDLMSALGNGAIVIGLVTTFDTAAKRAAIKGDSRPLLSDINQARALYKDREPLYNKYSTVQIDTDGKSVKEVVQAIIAKIRERL